MRFSILTKFFISFLVVSILLVGLMVSMIQFFSLRNFGDYVDHMELEKLDGLVSLLGKEYENNQTWAFIKNNHFEWTRLLESSGLIQEKPARSGISPRFPMNERPLAKPGQERRRPAPLNLKRPLLSENPLHQRFETGARLSLFDNQYRVIMGRGQSKKDHIFKDIVVQGNLVGYLGLHHIKSASNPLDAYFIERQKKMIYVVGALFLVASVLISFFLAHQFLKPIKILSRATKSLAKREFDTPLSVKTTDELGQLTNDFNMMMSQLSRYEQNQKQWLSDISHELRTPIAILIGEIDAIQDGIRHPDSKTMASLQAETLHLKRLVDDLHTLSVAEAKNLQIEKQPVDIIKLLAQIIDRFSDHFLQNGIELDNQISSVSPIILSGDPDRLIQLFSNIIKNSSVYTDSPGKVCIRCRINSSNFIVSIEDTAPAVPEKMMGRLFERLFRVDPSRSRKTGGSGLGLAICKDIVQAHSGSISAQKASLGGLKVQIELPLDKLVDG